jgi:hypothetical protein
LKVISTLGLTFETEDRLNQHEQFRSPLPPEGSAMKQIVQILVSTALAVAAVGSAAAATTKYYLPNGSLIGYTKSVGIRTNFYLPDGSLSGYTIRRPVVSAKPAAKPTSVKPGATKTLIAGPMMPFARK